LLLGITAALVDTAITGAAAGHRTGPDQPVRYVLDTGAADGLMMAHRATGRRVKLLLERDFPFVTLGRTELSTSTPITTSTTMISPTARPAT
jgi:hypothetical protein